MSKVRWRAVKIKRPFVAAYAAVAVVTLVTGLIFSRVQNAGVSAQDDNYWTGLGGDAGSWTADDCYNEGWYALVDGYPIEICYTVQGNMGQTGGCLNYCYQGYYAATSQYGSISQPFAAGDEECSDAYDYGYSAYFTFGKNKTSCQLACSKYKPASCFDNCVDGCEAAAQSSGTLQPSNQSQSPNGLSGLELLLQLLRVGGGGGQGSGSGITGVAGGTGGGVGALLPVQWASKYTCYDSGGGIIVGVPQNAGLQSSYPYKKCDGSVSRKYSCSGNPSRLFYQDTQCVGQCDQQTGECYGGGAGGSTDWIFMQGARCSADGRTITLVNGKAVPNPYCASGNVLIEFRCDSNGSVWGKATPCPDGCLSMTNSGIPTCAGNPNWTPQGSYPGAGGSYGGYYGQQQNPWWQMAQQFISQIMQMLFGWLRNAIGGGGYGGYGSGGGYGTSGGSYSSGGYSYTGGTTTGGTTTGGTTTGGTTTGGATTGGTTTGGTTTGGTTGGATTAIVQECADSDGGFNIDERGYVNQPGYGWDQCISDVRILENYCDENGYPIRIIDLCPYGCFDGACLPESQIVSPTASVVQSALASVSPTGTPITPTMTPTPTQTACAIKREVKYGFNAVQFSDKYSTSTFTNADMTVFEYLFNTDKEWRRTGEDELNSFFPNIGYYIYNPGPDREICLEESDETAPDITLKQGWNFLANSSDSAKALSEIKIRAPGASGEVGLDKMFEGPASTRRAYHKIFVVKNPYTGDANEAYETITATGDNIGTVKIPAGKTYWVHLFE